MEFDLSREWLETNGIGGFASSTVIGCNTRRYHALLCAATQPPLGRMVMVNKVDETLILNGRNFELGCNEYPGTIHPTGFHFLREFIPHPLPRWIYEVPSGQGASGQSSVLEKTLWMPHGDNTTIVHYALLEGEAATLSIHPFVTVRDYHGIHRYNSAFASDCTRTEDTDCHITMRPYADCPAIVWSHNGAFRQGGAWYYAFEYGIERERGLDFSEDAFCPGSFVWNIAPGRPATFVTSTEVRSVPAMLATREAEIERRAALGKTFRVPDVEAARLAVGADQFVVRRADGLHTVLAGYPWFSDWGRDTMIALPGLCLSTQRFDIARSILLAFAQAASQGMIPNRFPDAGEVPDYNTVDATLWFFHAVAEYLKGSGDWETVHSELYPVLRECIEWHIKGTRYGIHADSSDGMLWSGEAGTQLTWMDAKVGDWVVTPRVGKPVEIQALWFNALRTMNDLAARAGDGVMQGLCEAWSAHIQNNFEPAFWNETSGCLFDCINNEAKDGAIRPNQIFAVSLPHRLLSPERERRVTATVEEHLLTPHGLRSLSPRDPAYQGIYIGGPLERDGAYHQGTVWGWLIGPFLSAYLHVHKHSAQSKTQARAWLAPLLAHLDEACSGSISEIFDGNAPHTPRGCCAQAWSVAEVLRVLVDELATDELATDDAAQVG